MKLIPKPKPGEYSAYAEMYMKWLPGDGLILEHLKSNFLVMTIDENQGVGIFGFVGSCV